LINLGFRSVQKKILAEGGVKRNSALLKWVGPLGTHLWTSIQLAKGDAANLRDRIRSSVHHVSNEHRWAEDGEEKGCFHEPYEPTEEQDTRWLEKGSDQQKGSFWHQ
jgi:hypothetical protein